VIHRSPVGSAASAFSIASTMSSGVWLSGSRSRRPGVHRVARRNAAARSGSMELIAASTAWYASTSSMMVVRSLSSPSPVRVLPWGNSI
jgi:hypothetical protein